MTKLEIIDQIPCVSRLAAIPAVLPVGTWVLIPASDVVGEALLFFVESYTSEFMRVLMIRPPASVVDQGPDIYPYCYHRGIQFHESSRIVKEILISVT